MEVGWTKMIGIKEEEQGPIKKSPLGCGEDFASYFSCSGNPPEDSEQGIDKN